MDFPRRGDIYLVNFDPTIGHEIKKSRPALIITNNINNEYSPVVTVIPLSSNVSKIYPFDVRLSSGKGLEKESKIMINQIRSVDKKRLIKKLSSVSHESIKLVETAIKLHFDIDGFMLTDD
ncbi:MAG: type II toxin-antitoxin system PemK/MazF family toxin [Acidobacteria bacterium]|jgi:mRNA interferase MazF|nr:type II toxin-antitoxin system PemK/MazF family toxin [Acidobacteriota bacterium]